MKALNVLYTCSDSYSPFAGISMTSLLANNMDCNEIIVHVMTEQISKENLNRLQETARKYNRKIIIYEAEQILDKMKKMGINTYRGSYMPNARLFFDEFITTPMERLVYLDCDTIVTGSLKELLTMDMQGYPVAMVRDSLSGRYKELLSFAPLDDYFNAGMMVFDINTWRKENCYDRLMKEILEHGNCYCNTDQDIINVAMKSRVCVLPPRYNFQPVHRVYSTDTFFSVYPKVGYYSASEIEAAAAHPAIVHIYRYLGRFPWHNKNLHPESALFDYWMSQSCWSDYQKTDAKIDGIIRIERILYRILPKKLFLRLFAAAQMQSFTKQKEQLDREKKAKGSNSQ